MTIASSYLIIEIINSKGTIITKQKSFFGEVMKKTLLVFHRIYTYLHTTDGNNFAQKWPFDKLLFIQSYTQAILITSLI